MKNLKRIFLQRVILLASLLTLASCFHDSDPVSSDITTNTSAIVATIAADFSSGAHAVISEDENNVRMALNDLLATGSDITVAAFSNHFYRIERAFAGNNITKFASSEPQTPVWQYSTNDAGSAILSNPYDMVFVSETKAYVLRYGTGKVWIVNPSASTEADFKTGELDLSAYDTDGVPDMSSAVIVDDRLYITLQRLVSFAVTQNAYVAIFDINTDQEIDANMASNTLKGIPLKTRNPFHIIHEPASNVLFVQSAGTFSQVGNTGGIEKIDLADLSTTVIIDDGDTITYPYGLITELAAVSDSILYFVGSTGFGVTDNTLYRMNLTTEEVTETTVSSLINTQIAYLTVDGDGLLWVSDSANATVRIIDPVTGDEVDALSTNLNPDKIVFVN